ncbi:MAG: hypothetical protein GY792_16280, partial [Gammaproteobacteria bacterium]|nr:hypothetical protein [Gammaproteobacteria bacterium]
PDALEALRALDGVIGLENMDAAGLACAAKGAQALRVQVDTAPAPRVLSVSSRALDTNPSINVYRSPSGDYGYIYGYTDPSVTVMLTLKDSTGALKTSETTTSSNTGYYSFFPNYQSCTGYFWYPEPGDTVEVTVSGNTVSMSVATIAAFADPETDIVSGSTVPNRMVEVYANTTLADCDYTGNLASTTSNGSGAFSAHIPEGFDRSVSVSVWVYDANGNSIYTYTYPPRIELDYDGDTSGYLKPKVSFSAVLQRAGANIESFSGITDMAGWYSGEFSTMLQAGDVIQVSGGGLLVDLTYFEVTNLDFDLDNERITGNAGSLAAGFTAKITIDPSGNYSCDSDDSCASSTLDSAGNFSLNYAANGYDLRRGDYESSPDIYDDEGNYQSFRGRLVVPIIELYPQDNYVSVWGHWYEPNIPITITVRDSGGSVKGVDTDITGDHSASIYGFLYGFAIVPGDQVEVTDNTHTLTLASAPNLTGELNAVTNMLTGTATDGGTLIAELRYNYLDPVMGDESDWYCYQGSISAGSYSIDLSTQIDPTARDEVDIYYSDSDDHLTVGYSHAFAINAQKGSDFVKGHTPLPDTQVVIELWRAAAVQTVITTTSSSYNDSYMGNLGSVTISEGDIIRVKPQGITPYDLVIPELTVAEDPANNRVTGRAPTSAVLKVELDQPATYDDWEVITTADPSGNYAANFDVAYQYDCTPAVVGACTQPLTTYYNDAGHSVYIWGSEPAPVAADAYEGDDTYQTATPYTDPQSHTFHATSDVDWISFTVTSEDVGTPFYLSTKNLGFNSRTDLFLYDTDGNTLVASETSYSPNTSDIVWTPTISGTYYVKVEPYNSVYTVDCGSTYDFRIDRVRVFLPVTIR